MFKLIINKLFNKIMGMFSEHTKLALFLILKGIALLRHPVDYNTEYSYFTVKLDGVEFISTDIISVYKMIDSYYKNYKNYNIDLTFYNYKGEPELRTYVIGSHASLR